MTGHYALPFEKDWRGNKQAVLTTIGARNLAKTDREADDFYAIEPKAIHALFRCEQFHDVWECACGQGHLAEAIAEYGELSKASDKFDRGYGEQIDFLAYSGQALFNRFNCIVEIAALSDEAITKMLVIDVPVINFLFLVDGSGSMSGKRREAAVEALVNVHEVLRANAVKHAIAEKYLAKQGGDDRIIIMISDGAPAHSYGENYYEPPLPQCPFLRQPLRPHQGPPAHGIKHL